MSGSLQVRPIQANLVSDKDIFGKMDPYCIVHLGQYNVKGQVCKSGGRNPQWGDTITVQRNYEKVVLIELRDKDRFSADDAIGVCHIDLSSLPPNTPVKQWYPLQRWHSNAGEVLIELTFSPSNQQFGGQIGGGQVMYDPFKVSPYLSTHYQAGPHIGYQQPNYAQQPVYQQQQPIMQGGFQQQYQQPLVQQQPVYQQQQPVYQQQQPVFQQQQPVYQQQPILQQQPVYQQQQQPIYQQQQQPVFQQQQPVYQQQQPIMQGAIQQPVYQQPGFQQQQQPYGQPGYRQF